MVQYNPQNNQPLLGLLKNRMYADDFVINERNLNERKQKNKERIDAMVSYVSDHKLCRSIQIARYFNDHTLQPCGICDNCINNRRPAEVPEKRLHSSTRISSPTSIKKPGCSGSKMQLLKHIEGISLESN